MMDKNVLEISWESHEQKSPDLTELARDRFNFQHGFNAAFKLFGKSNMTESKLEKHSKVIEVAKNISSGTTATPPRYDDKYFAGRDWLNHL